MLRKLRTVRVRIVVQSHDLPVVRVADAVLVRVWITTVNKMHLSKYKNEKLYLVC